MFDKQQQSRGDRGGVGEERSKQSEYCIFMHREVEVRVTDTEAQTRAQREEHRPPRLDRSHTVKRQRQKSEVKLQEEQETPAAVINETGVCQSASEGKMCLCTV
ncbi:unnamed protein product [Pleuronectes platessa]|uniref:Uncharacterized protein n=1 Tax=Pleuronectes platessa TaxID=8262 RepID=A0A9N7VAT5_PLEPL|nr:unnamed protein product [Pleuronectes platessa]